MTLALLAAAFLLPGCAEAPEETPPRQLPGSSFHYPEELWDAGVEGETVLELHVGGDGGLRPTAVLLSIAASVKRHGLNPWAYLARVLNEWPARRMPTSPICSPAA